MEDFLKVFGNLTISQAVALIMAGIFLWKIYKVVDAHFTNKAIKSKEKDDQIKEMVEQVKQYPQWHQQSLDIREDINKRIGDLGEGVQSLLRESMIDNYNKYSEKGYCPIYAKESIKKVYKAYHGLGGNDVATELYHKLLAMPEEPEKEEDEHVQELCDQTKCRYHQMGQGSGSTCR